MKSSIYRLFFIFTLTLSTMLTISASRAFDEQLALKKFQTYAQENSLIFTFGTVEKPDDKTLVIKNADYFDDKTKQRQQIEVMTLGNVRESSNGILQYDTIEILNFNQKSRVQQSEVNISIERIFSSGLEFSDNTDQANVFWPSSTALAEVFNMVVTTQEDRGTVEVSFPKATARDIEQTNLRKFLARSITLEPATGTIKTGANTIAISLGVLNLENMEQIGAQGLNIGLINAGTLQMDFKTKTGEKIDFVFEGMTVENFFSPDITDENSPLYSDKDLKAEIKPLIATIDGKEFMGWKRGLGTTKNDEATNTTTSNGRIEAMYIDFGMMPTNPENAELIKTLEELNLVKMVLNVQGSGSWERDSGTLNITNYEFELEDGASFSMSARITGYTEKVAREFTKAVNAMNAEPDKNKKNTLALQIFAQIAGLSFERMELVLDDKSLLDRVVNLQAKKLKQDPEQIKGIVGPMTTIMLTPYNVPELAAQASSAFGTFMQGNKKLTITAEPENGLVITEMLALGSGVRAGSVTPADLAARLNLTIIAE